MTREEKLTRATSLSVFMVAGFAAVVSYVHIRALGLRYGYDGFTSALLPLAIDGMIVSTGFMLATAALARLKASVALLGLWLGVGTTIASNAAYGLPHGVVGAVVSAIPGAAFATVVEAWMQLQKRKRKSQPAKTTPKKPRNRGSLGKDAPPAAETIDISKEFEPESNLPSRQTVRVRSLPTKSVRKLVAIKPRRQSWLRS